MSPATEAYDRGEKREHYQRISSLREYVVLAQDAARAEIWRRTGAGGWSRIEIGAGQALELASIGCAFSVDELYADAGLDVR